MQSRTVRKCNRASLALQPATEVTRPDGAAPPSLRTLRDNYHFLSPCSGGKVRTEPRPPRWMGDRRPEAAGVAVGVGEAGRSPPVYDGTSPPADMRRAGTDRCRSLSKPLKATPVFWHSQNRNHRQNGHTFWRGSASSSALQCATLSI